MRRTLAALAALALLVAACGEDEPVRATGDTEAESPEVASSNLDDVEVVGEPGAEPTLEFEKPFGVTETVKRVIAEGEGEIIADSSIITFLYVVVNGTTGQTMESSATGGRQTLRLGSLPPDLLEALRATRLGQRVLIAIPPGDTEDPQATDTTLFFLEVLSVPLSRAEGVAVPPVEGLPTVVLDEEGAPTITVPTGDVPTELVIQPLIEGDGAVVESGQELTVHYTGVLYADGSVFDSSWQRGAPASFPIGTGGVIPGWDKGLVGQRIGSQILLVIPPADGYGDEGSGDSIPPGATLVFVVDILDAG